MFTNMYLKFIKRIHKKMILCGININLKKCINYCKNDFTNKQNSRNWCHTHPIIKLQQKKMNTV